MSFYPEIELKPCPFCGSSPCWIGNGKNGWRIKCYECGHHIGLVVKIPGGFTTAEEAAKIWNTREGDKDENRLDS